MIYLEKAISDFGTGARIALLHVNDKGRSRDWIERQLAHGDRDGVRAAYNYADYFPQRKLMKQDWADYLDRTRRPSSDLRLQGIQTELPLSFE